MSYISQSSQSTAPHTSETLKKTIITKHGLVKLLVDLTIPQNPQLNVQVIAACFERRWMKLYSRQPVNFTFYYRISPLHRLVNVPNTEQLYTSEYMLANGQLNLHVWLVFSPTEIQHKTFDLRRILTQHRSIAPVPEVNAADLEPTEVYKGQSAGHVNASSTVFQPIPMSAQQIPPANPFITPAATSFAVPATIGTNATITAPQQSIHVPNPSTLNQGPAANQSALLPGPQSAFSNPAVTNNTTYGVGGALPDILPIYTTNTASFTQGSGESVDKARLGLQNAYEQNGILMKSE